MAPTTRSQSAKSSSSNTNPDTTNSSGKSGKTGNNPANLTLPLTPAQISALHPSLASKAATKTTLTLSTDEIQELYTLAQTAAPSVLKNSLTLRCIGLGEHESRSPLSKMGLNPQGVLLLAIDPPTGNSLLHSAIAAKRVENASGLMGLFGPEMGHNGADPANGRNVAIRKLVWHLNKEGETVLHAAVRSGDLRAVVGLWRVICFKGVKDLLVEASEGEPEGEVGDGEDADWARFEHKEPVNKFDVGEGEYRTDIDETTWKEWKDALWVEKLLFVLVRNKEGKTAEELARDLGYERIVVWLGRLTETLDPKKRRESEFEMARMKRYVTWRNYEDEDGPERHRRQEEQYQRFLARGEGARGA
ncbi:hypothetical protein V8F33_011374 [Rhypophila sp. PSN 637]